MYLAAKFQRLPVFVKFAQICSDLASGFYIHLKIKATVSRDFGLKTLPGQKLGVENFVTLFLLIYL